MVPRPPWPLLVGAHWIFSSPRSLACQSSSLTAGWKLERRLSHSPAQRASRSSAVVGGNTAVTAGAGWGPHPAGCQWPFAKSGHSALLELEVEAHDVVIEVLVKAASHILQTKNIGSQHPEVVEIVAIGGAEGEEGVTGLGDGGIGSE